MTPAGRRPGPQTTRATILEAARDEFAATGYAKTTVRSVARAANVDPALVYHYFGDKPRLFAATLELGFDPRTVGERAMAAGGAFDGTRLAEEFLTRFEASGGAAFLGFTQAAAASPEAARAIREFLAARIGIGQAAGDPDGPWGLRHSMVASTLIGSAWSRWVLRVQPLASASPAQVAGWIGPVLDRYATDPEFSDEPPLEPHATRAGRRPAARAAPRAPAAPAARGRARRPANGRPR
jgi:AcrR family transcriptional regulator